MALFHPQDSLFHPPKEIVGEIFTVLLINLIAQVPLYALSFIMPSALQAAGDSKFSLGYVLGIVLHWGIVGVWLAMNCEWGVRGTLFLLRFLGKKWYQYRLIDCLTLPISCYR